MTAPLPVASRPYLDELISSWVGRVACRYGTSGAALLAARDPRPRGRATQPLDWQASPATLAVLGEAFRIDPGILRRLDLAEIRPSWPRHWFSWDGHGDGLGGAGEPERWGDIAPAFCRRCFREDAAAGRDAYLRQAWAQALGMCQAHREPLTGSCGWCGLWCGPRRSWRLDLRRGVARYVCGRCGHFVDQQPSPSRLDDPSDPLWLYAAEPVVPEIAELIAATWREVAHFEALIVAALSDPASSAFCPERKEAAAFARAVEDLAVLLCQPIAADGGRALMDGRGSEAFPLRAGRFRGVARGQAPLAFLSLAERQATIAAIAELLRPPRRVTGSAPHSGRTILEAAWRFDFQRLARLLEPESLSWLQSRANAWPAGLRQRVNTALSAAIAPHRREAGRLDVPHRALAEAILRSEAWRASRGRPAGLRRRLLGRLIRRALATEAGRGKDPSPPSAEFCPSGVKALPIEAKSSSDSG
jgi:hypothetical protein